MTVNYLLNHKFKWVMELGSGLNWSALTFPINFGELHTLLVSKFEEHNATNLHNLSMWVDGVIERLKQFCEDTDPSQLELTQSEIFFRSKNWPVVLHTSSSYWPEDRCPVCSSVTNGFHSSNCTNPKITARMRWGHWNQNDEDED